MTIYRLLAFLNVYIAVTVAWPASLDQTTTPDTPPNFTTWAEAVDPTTNLCRLSGNFRHLDDCNTCFCEVGKSPGCTLMLCQKVPFGVIKQKRSPAETGKIQPGGRCKPGERWQLDDCNNCVCTHTGYASCSLNECPQKGQKRPRRSPATTGKIQPGGRCKAGERWQLDECNNCVCTHTGYASCSLNECPQKGQKRPKRSPATTGKIQPGGRCKAGERWQLDECNNCVCTHTGYASCSLNDCSQKGQKRPKRGDVGGLAPQYFELVNEKGRCKGIGAWNEDCNSCFCVEVGAAYHCSSRDCYKLRRYYKRDARKENGNSGLECKPGVTWRQHCNSCFCSEKGIAMCTDIETCPSPPPAPAKNATLIATLTTPQGPSGGEASNANQVTEASNQEATSEVTKVTEGTAQLSTTATSILTSTPSGNIEESSTTESNINRTTLTASHSTTTLPTNTNLDPAL